MASSAPLPSSQGAAPQLSGRRRASYSMGEPKHSLLLPLRGAVRCCRVQVSTSLVARSPRAAHRSSRVVGAQPELDECPRTHVFEAPPSGYHQNRTPLPTGFLLRLQLPSIFRGSPKGSLGLASSPKRRECDEGEVIADYLVVCYKKTFDFKTCKGLQGFKDGFQMVHEFPEFACTFF